MDFGQLSKREAQLYADAYADGIEIFGKCLDIMQARFGDFIPYGELKELNAQLVTYHRNSTMKQIEALYDVLPIKTKTERNADGNRM